MKFIFKWIMYIIILVIFIIIEEKLFGETIKLYGNGVLDTLIFITECLFTMKISNTITNKVFKSK